MYAKPTSRRACRVLGPLSLLVCLTVLCVVYYTAYGVGTSSQERRRLEMLQASVAVLEQETAELQRCHAAVARYSSTSVMTSDEAAAVAAEAMAGLTGALEAGKTKQSRTRRALHDCTQQHEKLQGTMVEGRSSEQGRAVDALNANTERLSAQLTMVSGWYEEVRTAPLPTVPRLKTALQSAITELSSSGGQAAATVSRCQELSRQERYSAVFDIGSTGNRVHVFKFVSAPDAATGAAATSVYDMTLKEELFELNRVPMSKQQTKEDVIAALDTLYKAAVAYVPAAAQPCTPVEFKATAGLRKIGPVNASRTLRLIRDHYAANGALWLRGSRPARILEGSEEGPMAWMTVNYLRGALRTGSAVLPAAIIDLGGGSTQIVFEPADGMPAEVKPADTVTVKVGQRQLVAYQHSYDGLGLHDGTNELLLRVQGKCTNKEANYKSHQPDAGAETTTLPPADLDAATHFPCFAVGYEDAGGGVRHDRVENGDEASAKPSFDRCVALFRRFVLGCGTDAAEDGPRCRMHGKHQPSLPAVTGPIYAFSFIYDLMDPYRGNSTSEEVSMEQLAAVGRARCDELTLEKIAALAADGEKSSLKPPYTCLYYSYVYALLRYGYGVPASRQLTVAKKINGFETAWALGAALETLGS